MKELLEKYFGTIRKRKKRTFIFSLVLYVIVLLIIVGAMLNGIDKINSKQIVGYLTHGDALAMILLGFFFPFLALINSLPFLLFRKTAMDWPVYKLAVGSPENVAWVYKTSTALKVYSAQVGSYEGLNICSKEGKRFRLAKIKREELEQVISQLPQQFPKATLGWSDELEKLYQSRPWELLKK